MVETFGDATRDGEWAAVRLLVEGDRIVEADADGLTRPLKGLTLLEAAAGPCGPVVDAFVRDFECGETPNPCIRCNGTFRFAELLAFARRAGADRLATGHYARAAQHRGRLLLARAADPAKDQSYMLAQLDPRHLDR